MTSRERILAAIHHQPEDRVPTDIWATDEAWAMLAARYGYILAPCHNLQSNTPLENIIALYDEAWHYGQW